MTKEIVLDQSSQIIGAVARVSIAKQKGAGGDQHIAEMKALTAMLANTPVIIEDIKRAVGEKVKGPSASNNQEVIGFANAVAAKPSIINH